MFGKNAITKPMPPDALLNVHSIFYTLQGEGPWAGLPTIFVRFAGCNLRCFWCDTDFEKGTEYTPAELVHELRGYVQKYHCMRFVLTGGEPLIQPLGAFFAAAPVKHWLFQAETAGTVWPEGLEDAVSSGRLTLVCSPKTGKVHEQVEAHCRAWKYIVDDDCLGSTDGLPTRSTQVPGQRLTIHRVSAWRPNTGEQNVIYVQPLDTQDPVKNERNLKVAADICLRHGYRLSVQVHKLVGLP